MKWLNANWTTLVMASLLSLVTVVLLSEPSEEVRLIIPANFEPDVRADVGSLEYSLDGSKVTTRVQVTLTAENAEIAPRELTCRPILEGGVFPPDPTKRETLYKVEAKDFILTPEQKKRISIEPFWIKINYAPIMERDLPIDVSIRDIRGAEDSPYRVERVRAFPPEIKVRLPVDRAETLKSLAVRPVTIKGREESFTVTGALNSDHPDMKDVRAARDQQFLIAVDLRLVEHEKTLEGIPLQLCHLPLPPDVRVDLVDKPVLRIVVDGPKDVVEKVRPEQILAFVNVQWAPGWAPGQQGFPIRVDVKDDALRKQVRVSLLPGEPIMALVLVTRTEKND
jgi:hypothetical protein